MHMNRQTNGTNIRCIIHSMLRGRLLGDDETVRGTEVANTHLIWYNVEVMFENSNR